MKAFVIREHGGPEALRLEEREAPQPGPLEVRLRVRAAALNHLDLWARRGVPGHRYPLPLVPGSDGYGIVEALGPGVSGIAPGEAHLLSPGYGCGHCEPCLRGEESLCRDYVILGENRDGVCAESIVVPAATLLAPLENLPPEEAVALPLVLLTAWRMLIKRARLAPGETVLVHSAGSGVGSMAIQIATALGCRVIATVGAPEKIDHARTLGAAEVIVHTREDVAERVRLLTGKRGVDVVVEHTGEATWETSLRALARGGRLVTCGATSGAAAAINLRVLFFKQLSLLGSTMGSRADLDEGLRLVRAGKIRPVVDRTFAMEELPEAHRYLESRVAFGKVTLRGFGETR
jgi:NADPH:quinone reductase-like Zn-dependent oxidoreductase